MHTGIRIRLTDQEGGTPLSAWLTHAWVLPYPAHFLLMLHWQGRS